MQANSTRFGKTNPQALLLSYCGTLLLAQGLLVFVIGESLALTLAGVGGVLLATTGVVFVYDGVRRFREDRSARSDGYGLQSYAILGFAVVLTGLFVFFVLSL